MSKHLIIFLLTDIVKMEVSIILLFLPPPPAIVTRSRSRRNVSSQYCVATESKAESRRPVSDSMTTSGGSVLAIDGELPFS